MKKKLLVTSLLGLAISLNYLPTSVSNQSLLEVGNDTLNTFNPGVSIKKVATGEAVENSTTFVQYAEKEGSYYLRFATAVKGNIEKLSYTRELTPLEGDTLLASKTTDLNVVYKSISADNQTYYYNGTELTTTETEETKNYYWACYTIKFADADYYNTPISVSLSVNDTALPAKTVSLNELITKYDVVIDDLTTYRVEAENLDTSNATLRSDFIAAGRGFVENGAGASGGANICGYEPGSSFKISLNVLEDSEVYITSSMSDTTLGYDLNEGLKVQMDGTTLPTLNDVVFTYEGKGDYWNWKDVIYGKVSLTKGQHVFTIDSISARPNLDYFDFAVVKHGTQEVEKVVTSIEIAQMPTKTQYEENQLFDRTGMVVKAHYSNYDVETITDYTVDIENKPLTISDEKAVISYQGLTATVNINVGKSYQLKLTSLGDHVFEAEDLKVDDKWIMREDMAAQGHTTYVVDSANSSGGKSIERYKSGTIFTLEFLATEDITLRLTSTLSNYDDFNLNNGIKFKVDDQVLNSDNPTFGHRYGGDFYNWQTASFDPINLTKGEHIFTVEIGIQANFDCFNFHVTKFKDTAEPHTLSSLGIASMPTKTDYLVGECFDPTGMKLKLVYTDTLYELSEDFVCDTTTPLTADMTSITVTCGELSINVPITVKNITAVISEAQVIKIEGEDFDKTKIKNNGNGYIENTGNASGGKCLGNGSNGTVEWTYELTKDMILNIENVICKYEAFLAKNQFKIFVDGVEITLEDPSLTLGGTSDNPWFNFKTVKYTAQNLAAGTHSIKIEFNCNVDYIQFSFTEA